MAAVITFLEPDENNQVRAPVPVLFWQRYTIGVAKCLSIYCGVTIIILFIITWLILTGCLLDGSFQVKNDVLLMASVPDKHSHTIQFYALIMTILVSVRGGLYYMAGALKRAAEEVDSGAICIWLGIALSMLVTQMFLGIALLECLPGTMVVILLFLVVEIIVESTFIWIVWNFRMELSNALIN